MRIISPASPYNNFYNSSINSFKGAHDKSETRVFAYDDTCSQEIRKQIRSHISESYPCIRDEEQEYKHYVEVTNRLLTRKKLYTHLNPPVFTEFEPGCIRGGGFDSNLFGYLHDVKNVKRVIALAPDTLKEDLIKEEAKKAGVEYVPSKVVYGENKMLLQETPFMDEDEFVRPMLQRAKDSGMPEDRLEEMSKGIKSFLNASSRKYIEDELIPFIDTMKKGNIYMACQYGTFRTDTAISLNSWFNPECEHPFQCLNSAFDLYAFNNLYKKLTDTDKQKLGFTPEFEKEFQESMKTSLARYCR